MVPSDAQPDMSQLQLVPESEIRKGIMIGSGAFGTVYRVKFCLASIKGLPISLAYSKVL